MPTPPDRCDRRFSSDPFAGRLLPTVILAVLLVGAAAVPHSFQAAAGAQAGSAPPASAIASPAAAAVGPGDRDPVLYDAVLPAERDAVVAATAGRLSRYRIDAAIAAVDARSPGSVTGTLDLRYVNDTGGDLDELFFRLYANDPSYGEGGLRVDDASVDGTAVAAELSLDDTVLRLPLPDTLPAAAAADVRLSFAATVPVRPSASYGIFAVQPLSGTTTLAHWFPILAGRDAAGWSLDPVSRNGDPIFSNVALFDVSLAAPDDLVLVASGQAVSEEANIGSTRRRYVTGPARDFTVVADADFERVERRVGDSVVTSYFNPSDARGGAEVLDYGARALETFGELFGPYPYRELDLVQVQLRGAGGVEFPQLVFIGDDLYVDTPSRNPHYLEFVTAHEVGHQWWYGLVGNNQHVDAFIDEGLTEYASSIVYFEERYDDATARDQFDREVKLWYLNHLFTAGDGVVDQATDSFPSEASYGALVYGKAAVGFDAIRTEIGEDAFYTALRDYHRAYRFGVATPADLLAALERAAGRDLDDLWGHWFAEAAGTDDFTAADYLDLLRRLGLG